MVDYLRYRKLKFDEIGTSDYNEPYLNDFSLLMAGFPISGHIFHKCSN